MFAYIEHLIAALVGRAGQTKIRNIVGRFDSIAKELQDATDALTIEREAIQVKKAALIARDYELAYEHDVATKLHGKITNFLN